MTNRTANAGHREFLRESKNSSPEEVWAGRSGNVFGFYVEENSGGADAYVCFYDAASAGSVTPGTTPVTASYRIKAGQGFGKDAISSGLHHFKAGCVALIAANRDGSSPTTGDTLKIWYQG